MQAQFCEGIYLEIQPQKLDSMVVVFLFISFCHKADQMSSACYESSWIRLPQYTANISLLACPYLESGWFVYTTHSVQGGCGIVGIANIVYE